MRKTTQVPPPGFDKMSVSEKIEYVQFLWQSIAADADSVPVPEWHKKVLAERMKEPSSRRAQPWTRVRRQIETALRRRRG